MVKRKSEATQERILNTAAELFVRDGYAASRTSAIAEASGVSEGTVFKYYKSKQGILDAVVNVVLKNMTKQFVINPLNEIFETHKEEAPEVMFKAIFMNRIELVSNYKNYVLVMFTESRFQAHIKKTIREQIMPEIMIFSERLVDYYKARGVFKEEVDAWLMMRSMMASVVGMFTTKEILGIELHGGSMESELEKIIDMMLSGIKTKA